MRVALLRLQIRRLLLGLRLSVALISPFVARRPFRFHRPELSMPLFARLLFLITGLVLTYAIIIALVPPFVNDFDDTFQFFLRMAAGVVEKRSLKPSYSEAGSRYPTSSAIFSTE